MWSAGQVRKHCDGQIYSNPRKPLDASILFSGFICLIDGDNVGCLSTKLYIRWAGTLRKSGLFGYPLKQHIDSLNQPAFYDFADIGKPFVGSL